jgi:hypothetical protein
MATNPQNAVLSATTATATAAAPTATAAPSSVATAATPVSSEVVKERTEVTKSPMLTAAAPAPVVIKERAELIQFANTLLTWKEGNGLGSRQVARITNVNLVAPYKKSAALPAMPVCFPYNAEGTMAILMAIRLPATPDNLPSGVTQLLSQHQINMNNLEVNFCVQDMPVTWIDQRILLRPHPFLHPTAPESAAFSAASNILVGFSNINEAFGALKNEPPLTTHQGDGGEVIFSGDQLPVEFMDSITKEKITPLAMVDKTYTFYSFCIEPATGRAALTLHWLVNENDFQKLKSILPNTKTIEEFILKVVTTNNISLNQSVANKITPVQALYKLVHGDQLMVAHSEPPAKAAKQTTPAVVQQPAQLPVQSLPQQTDQSSLLSLAQQIAYLQEQFAKSQKEKQELQTTLAFMTQQYDAAERRANQEKSRADQEIEANNQLAVALKSMSDAYYDAENRYREIMGLPKISSG